MVVDRGVHCVQCSCVCTHFECILLAWLALLIKSVIWVLSNGKTTSTLNDYRTGFTIEQAWVQKALVVCICFCLEIFARCGQQNTWLKHWWLLFAQLLLHFAFDSVRKILWKAHLQIFSLQTLKIWSACRDHIIPYHVRGWCQWGQPGRRLEEVSCAKSQPQPQSHSKWREGKEHGCLRDREVSTAKPLFAIF